MENRDFWAFFVIALVVGSALTLGIVNVRMTGAITWPWQQKILPIDDQIETCKDSDGGNNEYVKGTCTDKYGRSWTDVCLNNNRDLKEYYCDSGNNCASVILLGGGPGDHGGIIMCRDGKLVETNVTTEVTYQGVLEMLRGCRYYTHVQNANNSINCDDWCNSKGKTCTFSFKWKPNLEYFGGNEIEFIPCYITISPPIDGKQTVICACCSP